MKRITFNEADATEIYELALQNFQDGCWRCQNTKKRLEKFLGESNVKYVKKTIKEHPYDDHNMSWHFSYKGAKIKGITNELASLKEFFWFVLALVIWVIILVTFISLLLGC